MADPITPPGFLLYLPPVPQGDFVGVQSRFILIEEARPGESAATRFWDIDLTIELDGPVCPEYLRQNNLHQGTVQLGSSRMSSTKYAILQTGQLGSHWQGKQDALTFTSRDGEVKQSRPGFAHGHLVRIDDWELIDDEDIDRVRATILGEVAVAPFRPNEMSWDVLKERITGAEILITMLEHGLMGKHFGRPTWEEVARDRRSIRVTNGSHGRSHEDEQKMTFLGREQVHEDHLVRENEAHQVDIDQGRQQWRRDPLRLNEILSNVFAAGAYFERDTVEWIVNDSHV